MHKLSIVPRRVYHTETIELNGLQIQLREWPGPEPTLLMLHGFLDTGLTFFELAEHLPMRLLAWDARGFGQSDWLPPSAYYHFYDYLYDLQALIQHYQLAPVHLLGHSMGGMIASLYAGVFPEQLASLINLEGWMIPDGDPSSTPERLALWLQERPKPKSWQTWPDLAAAAKRLQKQDPLLSSIQAEVLAQAALNKTDKGVVWSHDPLHRIHSPQPFRLDQALACWQRITAPTLLLAGDQSTIHQLPDQALRLQAFAMSRHLEHLIIPEAGHNLHLHQPKAVAAAIQRFLQTQL